MPSVSEILLQHGRDVAAAAQTRGAARAQLAQTLGAIPGQVINNYQQMTQFADARKAEATQQKTREAQATTAQVGARTATTNERDVNTYKDIIGKLPKVTENGLQLTDVEALNRELTAARIDPAPYVQHAQAMNTAFRAEFSAKQALIKTGADQVARSGNQPGFADITVDGYVANKLITPEDGEKYKQFYTLDENGQPLSPEQRIERVGQLTKYLGNPRTPVEVSAGAQRFDPVTNEPLGPQVPQNVTQATLAAAAAQGDQTALKAIQLLKGNEANPTAASLALKAARGDAEAMKALELLKQQQQGPQAQHMWAQDKDGNVRLMTPQEIRAEGAGQAPTTDMRNMGAVKAAASRAVSAVRALGDKVITKVGPKQRADAIKRGVEAVFGSDPEFRTYQDARMATAGTLAVEQQGKRVSDADVKLLWLPMVPDAYRDTTESSDLKWELIDIMRGGNSGAPGTTTTRVSQGGKTYDVVRDAAGKVISSAEVK